MKNRSIIIIIVIVAVIIVILGFGSYTQAPVTPTIAPAADTTPVDTTPAQPEVSGDTANLLQFSVMPGQKVDDGQTIMGALSGNYFFEANARGMLLDGSKAVLKSFPITAVSDWMTAGAVQFSFVLDTTGVPAGPGYIRLASDNPSGLPQNDKYVDIPVVF